MANTPWHEVITMSFIMVCPSFSYWFECYFIVSFWSDYIYGRPLGANFEFDLRRIIALSTLRQLGLMIIIISIGLSSLAFFHVLTHALFKALLFMCAGGVIHSIGDSQDINFLRWFVYLYAIYFLEFNSF